MHKLIYLVLVFAVVAYKVEAKRDFFVAKEVRCGIGNMCYEKATDQPLNGKLRLYYPHGEVREDSEYQNGLRNGVQSLFYRSGNQSSYKVYKNGKVHGGATTYYDNGNVICESSYNMGQLDGDKRCYFEAGQIESEEKYVNGERDGKLKKFDANGNVINEMLFNMGKPVFARCRQASGRWVDYSLTAESYFLQNKTPCDGN